MLRLTMSGLNPITELLYIGKREYIVEIDNAHVKWTSSENSTFRKKCHWTVCVEDILGVSYENNLNTHNLSIHYVYRKSKSIWKAKQVKFIGDQECITKVKDRLIGSTGKVEKVIVFINPNSGKKNGVEIFQRKVAPLFDLYNVSYDVIVTTGTGHARDVLQTHGFIGIDGIVTVGGDGLYCECLSGILRRTQLDSDIDYDNPESVLKATAIPIGIIPAGSGDIAVQFLNKTRDVITATLRILLGKCRMINTVSLHQGGHLTAYAGLLMNFGLSGDLMKSCEKMRWMGPSRYTVMSIVTLLSRRLIDVDVETKVMKATEDKAVDQRVSNCEEASVQLGWRRQNVRVYGVDTYVSNLEPTKNAMEPRFDSESMDVILTSRCSCWKHIQHFQKLGNLKLECFDYEFIRQIKTVGYRVKLKMNPEEPYYINCDGEPIEITFPEFDIRLHHKVLSVFG